MKTARVKKKLASTMVLAGMLGFAGMAPLVHANDIVTTSGEVSVVDNGMLPMGESRFVVSAVFEEGVSQNSTPQQSLEKAKEKAKKLIDRLAEQKIAEITDTVDTQKQENLKDQVYTLRDKYKGVRHVLSKPSQAKHLVGMFAKDLSKIELPEIDDVTLNYQTFVLRGNKGEEGAREIDIYFSKGTTHHELFKELDDLLNQN